MNKKIKACFAALPAAVLAVGVKTFCSPCIHTDGTTGACTAAGKAVFWAALGLAVLFLARAFLPKAAKRAADVLAFAGSVVTLFLPGLLGTCMMQSMRCNTVMKPSVWALSAVCALAALVLFIRDIRPSKE